MKFSLKRADINYATISYKDNNNSPCTTRIGIKELDSSIILATAKFKDDFFVITPQEVLLKFVCDDGIYHAKTDLISFFNEIPYVFFRLSTPQEVEYQQKREFFRVVAQYDCIFKLKNNDTESDYKSKTIDVSAGGISILVPSEAIAKSISEITLKINNNYIKTKVIYVRSSNFDNSVKASFQFNNITDKDREFITQACLQKQLEERRKTLK